MLGQSHGLGQGCKAPAPQPRQEGHPQPVLFDWVFLLQTVWPSGCIQSLPLRGHSSLSCVRRCHAGATHPNPALGCVRQAAMAGRKGHSPSRPWCPSDRGCHLPPVQTQREGSESEPLRALEKKGSTPPVPRRVRAQPPQPRQAPSCSQSQRKGSVGSQRHLPSSHPREAPRASDSQMASTDIPPSSRNICLSEFRGAGGTRRLGMCSGIRSRPQLVASDTSQVPGVSSFLIWKVGVKTSITLLLLVGGERRTSPQDRAPAHSVCSITNSNTLLSFCIINT